MLVIGCGLGLLFNADSTSHAASVQPEPTTTVAGSLTDQQTKANVELAQAQRALALQQAESAHMGDSAWRQLLTPGASVAAGLLTAIVAFFAVILPLKKQRELDRQQRTDADRRDVEQREKDRQQRFDVGFAAAVSALGNDNTTVQAGAAAALQSYLRPDLNEFLDQVYLVVRANLDLRITHADPVRNLLVTALCQALAKRAPVITGRPAPRTHASGRGDGPDLARTWIQSGDLRQVNLAAADVAFSNLRDARLDGTSLRRSRGWKTDLGGASLRGADMEEARFRRATAVNAVFDKGILVSARFEEATLSGARFRSAQCQSTHFDNAVLDGADFRNAHIDGASFRGATFDDAALMSLLLSTTWRPLGSPRASEADRRAVEIKMRRYVDQQTADRLIVLAGRRRSGIGSAPEDAPAHSKSDNPT